MVQVMQEWSHRWHHRAPNPSTPPHYSLTWLGLSAVRVNYIMRDSGVLRHRQHVVAGAGDGVPDQKHAVPLPLQHAHSLRSGQAAPVPALAVRRVKSSGHDHQHKAEALPVAFPALPPVIHKRSLQLIQKTLAPRARSVNRRHPQLAVWAPIRRYRRKTAL